jgi:hypothetical protein
MSIDSHLSTCVGTQSPKYLEMAQRHISLSPSSFEALFPLGYNDLQTKVMKDIPSSPQYMIMKEEACKI